MAAATWTVVTGDTFLPSLGGALFATWLRHKVRGPGAPLDLAEIVIGTIASLVIGLVTGPYIASQMPDGAGVVGVGALIASFMALGVFTRLHELDWDLSALLREFGGAIGKAMKPKDKP